jgi:hypothetical protein
MEIEFLKLQMNSIIISKSKFYFWYPNTIICYAKQSNTIKMNFIYCLKKIKRRISKIVKVGYERKQ